MIWRYIRPHISRLVRFFHISLIEARSERRASRLGVLWKPLSTLLFTGVLALVFMHPQSDSIGHFYLYVLAGYIAWGFISASIAASTNVIQRRYDFAIHNNLTLAGLFFKLLIDRVFLLLLDIGLLLAAIIILAPGQIGLHLLLMVPLLVMLSFVSLATAYLVNLMVISYPDLDAMFEVGVRFMFFASPVFWGSEGDATGLRAVLLEYNPVVYFLSVFRQVFGITPFASLDWIISGVVSAVICGSGWIAFLRTQDFVRNLK